MRERTKKTRARVADVEGTLPIRVGPWRALVRIVELRDEAAYVVVPAWEPEEVVRIPAFALPEDFFAKVKEGARIHAQVNIGAESREDLYFTGWEYGGEGDLKMTTEQKELTARKRAVTKGAMRAELEEIEAIFARFNISHKELKAGTALAEAAAASGRISPAPLIFSLRAAGSSALLTATHRPLTARRRGDLCARSNCRPKVG